MNVEIRQQLVSAAQSTQTREILTFLYRDHPQGASFDGVKERLFLHDAFQEETLTELVQARVLAFDGTRYTLAAPVRQVLDRDPTILMDEFLR